jgi:hypothetical protein
MKTFAKRLYYKNLNQKSTYTLQLTERTCCVLFQLPAGEPSGKSHFTDFWEAIITLSLFNQVVNEFSGKLPHIQA